MKNGIWPVVNLGSMVKFLSGGTPSKSEENYWNGNVPWVSSGEMAEDRIYSTHLNLTDDGVKNGSRLIPKNTLLAVVRGMSLAKEFRVCLTMKEMTFNQDVKAIIPSKEVNPVFLFYYLKSQSNQIRDSASEAAHGTKKLDMPVLEQWPLPLPSLEIQKKIVGILSAYDDLIENNKRRIALLENMAEELYREWFVRFRFPGWREAEFEKGIPKGWEVKTIGDVYKTASGGTPSRKNQNNYDGDINWLKTGELKNTFAFESEEKITTHGLESSSTKIFPAGTVVIAMYCAMPDITILGEDAATNQACCAFLPKKKYFDYPYTYYLIKFSQNEMIQFAHGAAQQNLSQELIKGFKLLVASEDLIKEFSNQTIQIFEKIKNLFKVNENLAKTKNALLPRLISGKLAVEDLAVQLPPSMCEAA